MLHTVLRQRLDAIDREDPVADWLRHLIDPPGDRQGRNVRRARG